MAKTISFQPFTLPEGETDFQIYVNRFDFENEFVELDSGSNGTAILSALNASIDRPVTGRISVRDVKNVYSGTTVDPAYQSMSRAGLDVVVEWKEIASVVDSDNPTLRVDLPFRCAMTWNLPRHEVVTQDTLVALAARTLGMLAKTSDTSLGGSGAAAILHGSLAK